jgi:adenine-specific DNA-methyltransferase
MMLTNAEKAEIKALIDRGEPLPDDYRFRLFAEPRETELIWPGKTRDVTNAVLPFQVIEQVDEPRAEAEAPAPDLFEVDRTSGRQQGGWTNKLIWGDNKLVLSSLKNGPMRREIEKAGGLKLVYIDPPFDVGADFSYEITVGEDSINKEPSAIEDIAYRDTWGRGQNSYAAMLHERLIIIREIMAEDGVIFVHCDWHVNHLIKAILAEVFGGKNQINEIVWHYYNKMQGNVNRFPSNHDCILWFRKSENFYFQKQKEQRESPTRQIKRVWSKEKSRIVNAKDDSSKVLYIETNERGVDSVWTLPMLQPADKTENVGYATQKPETVIARIIEAATRPGELVADFFCGSGTTLAVAEKLGRKWIGCDLGRFAIHTSRKRLIGVQRELKHESKPWRSFEILNLGRYERQYFVGIDPTLPEEQRRAISAQKEEHYLTLILQAYKAERIFQSPPFHGRKGPALVLVGPVDAPVTSGDCKLAVDAARRLRVSQVHVLGFEFEMGMTPRITDEARAQGVNLALRHIPKEVFDKRAVEKNQVTFYDVAYVEARPKVSGLAVRVQLERFAVAYTLDDAERLSEGLKEGKSGVIVSGGQVVKITKTKGVVTREILTRQWTDWIDYWAVDFDYENRREIVTVTAPDATGRMVDRQQWTGGFIFENEWQSYRTRRERKLELMSAPHTYPKRGRYKIAVKVIDIFGNDTTKVVEVTV